ncbi:MAG: helix-turn-helix domain-containing protein [Verrucomicrobiota bacterium]
MNDTNKKAEALKIELGSDGSVRLEVSAMLMSSIRTAMTDFVKALAPVVIVPPLPAPIAVTVKPPPLNLPPTSKELRTPPQDYLSVHEIGQQYGVSDRTVWRWIAGYDLPHYRIRKMVRLKADEVREWVEKQQRRR